MLQKAVGHARSLANISGLVQMLVVWCQRAVCCLCCPGCRNDTPADHNREDLSQDSIYKTHTYKSRVISTGFDEIRGAHLQFNPGLAKRRNASTN